MATKQCLHCLGVNDTVEYTFFGCVRYSDWRPEIVVPEMLRSPENWDKVAEYVMATLLTKKEEGFPLYRALPSLGREEGNSQLPRLRVPN